MPVTQQAIADELGLSRQIVGQALNGHPRVAAATRTLVVATAERLGYDTGSNRAARELIARRYGKRVKTGIIAVLFTPVFHGEAVAGSPLVIPLFAGIKAAARQYDSDVVLCTPDGEELPRLIRDGRVDGVVCYMTYPLLGKLRELGLPAVTMGQHDPRLPSTLPNGREGMAQATRHLIELGHRRIGYLGFGTHFEEGAMRLAGYTMAMEEAGLEPTPWLHPYMFAGPSLATGRMLAIGLMSRHQCTAMVCYNDPMAMGAIRAVEAAGLTVPGDISVIGFDDVGEEYGFRPSLTSVAFDKFALGIRALELLERAMTETDGRAPVAWCPTWVVQRASTARLPVHK